MRVMVTGHYGYIGSILVPMLIEAGHDVVGLDSNLFERSLYGGWRWPEIRTIHKDIRDVTEADLEGCDAVLHLAGMCNDPLGDLMPELTMAIRSEEHTSELQSLMRISYAVFCLKKKNSNKE